MSMNDLRFASFNTELVVKEIFGSEEQIRYLEYLGIAIGKEITILSEGALENSLIVQVDKHIYHLNSDAVKRIIVEEKEKTLKKHL